MAYGHSARVRTRRAAGDDGFTLVELLVVVLIIGVLTAIAVPVFLGQQNDAKNAVVKSDLTQARIALISYAAAHDGAYLKSGGAQLDGSDLSPFGYTLSTGTSAFQVTADALGTFCISEKSAAMGNPTLSITATTEPTLANCP